MTSVEANVFFDVPWRWSFFTKIFKILAYPMAVAIPANFDHGFSSALIRR